MKRKAVVFTMAVLLAGCIGASEVVKTGPDTYLVIGHSDSGIHAGEGPLAAAKRANEFCAAQSRDPEVLDTKTHGIPGLTVMTTDYAFRCVPKS
jgi:hypothetical protein